MTSNFNKNMVDVNDPESALKALVDFPGWGNPNRGIWFVGIEEKGDWTEKGYKEKEEEYKKKVYEQIARNYNRPNEDGYFEFDYNNDIDLKKYEPFYDNISKFMCKILGFDAKGKGIWQESDNSKWNYKKNYLTKNRNDIKYNSFITNIFPLGKPNYSKEAWKKVQKDYFYLFNLRDHEHYNESIKNLKRREKFKEYFIKSKPEIIIFFGINEDITEFLPPNIILEQKIIYEKEKMKIRYKYCIYNNRLILQTYHISRNYLYIRIRDYLIDKINKFISTGVFPDSKA